MPPPLCWTEAVAIHELSLPVLSFWRFDCGGWILVLQKWIDSLRTERVVSAAWALRASWSRVSLLSLGEGIDICCVFEVVFLEGSCFVCTMREV